MVAAIGLASTEVNVFASSNSTHENMKQKKAKDPILVENEEGLTTNEEQAVDIRWIRSSVSFTAFNLYVATFAFVLSTFISGAIREHVEEDNFQSREVQLPVKGSES